MGMQCKEDKKLARRLDGWAAYQVGKDARSTITYTRVTGPGPGPDGGRLAIIVHDQAAMNGSGWGIFKVDLLQPTGRGTTKVAAFPTLKKALKYANRQWFGGKPPKGGLVKDQATADEETED